MEKPDQHDVAQVQRLDQRRQIVGIGVHVVAAPRLAGSPVPAPIVGDGAEAVRGHEEHLRFPAVGVQRPAVAEDDRLPGAPVLVVDPVPSFTTIVSLMLCSPCVAPRAAAVRGEAGEAASRRVGAEERQRRRPR